MPTSTNAMSPITTAITMMTMTATIGGLLIETSGVHHFVRKIVARPPTSASAML
jgi:hypothetical protein